MSCVARITAFVRINVFLTNFNVDDSSGDSLKTIRPFLLRWPILSAYELQEYLLVFYRVVLVGSVTTP